MQTHLILAVNRQYFCCAFLGPVCRRRGIRLWFHQHRHTLKSLKCWPSSMIAHLFGYSSREPRTKCSRTVLRWLRSWGWRAECWVIWVFSRTQRWAGRTPAVLSISLAGPTNFQLFNALYSKFTKFPSFLEYRHPSTSTSEYRSAKYKKPKSSSPIPI